MHVLLLLFSPLLAIGTDVCQAETQQHGAFDIHYTAFPSKIIPATVAQAHQISRADNKIVLNVSLKRDNQPAVAYLKGQVINLLEQVIELDFVEVRERDAIYYLATHISLPEDILRFNLLVTPIDSDPIAITFMRRYD